MEYRSCVLFLCTLFPPSLSGILIYFCFIFHVITRSLPFGRWVCIVLWFWSATIFFLSCWIDLFITTWVAIRTFVIFFSWWWTASTISWLQILVLVAVSFLFSFVAANFSGSGMVWFFFTLWTCFSDVTPMRRPVLAKRWIVIVFSGLVTLFRIGTAS